MHQEFVLQDWRPKKNSVLSRYTLRWILFHALIIEDYDRTSDIIHDVSFVYQFSKRYMIGFLSFCWNRLEQKGWQADYDQSIQHLIQQPCTLLHAKQLDSLMSLFCASHWYDQGTQYIDKIITWAIPLNQKYPKIVSNFKMSRGTLIFGVGDINDGIEGYMDAFQNLTERGSKSAAICLQIFQKFQAMLHNPQRVAQDEYQQLWEDLQSNLPLHDRNRFSFEIIILDLVFSDIEEQLTHLDTLKERIPLIRDKRAKANLEDRLEQSILQTRFNILYKNTRYKEALTCGLSLLPLLNAISLAAQIKLQCRLGICMVHLKQNTAACVLYENLQKNWFPRFKRSQHLLQHWFEFSSTLAQKQARAFQKKKEWKKALYWADIEVFALAQQSMHLQSVAQKVSLSSHGNWQNKHAIALYQRGNIHKYQKNITKAKEDYRSCIHELEKISTLPKSIFRKNLSLGWHVLAGVYEGEKNHQEALHAYQKALAIRSALRSVREDMEAFWCQSAIKVSSLMFKRYSVHPEQHKEELVQLLQLRKDIFGLTQKITHRYGIVVVLNTIGLAHFA